MLDALQALRPKANFSLQRYAAAAPERTPPPSGAVWATALVERTGGRPPLALAQAVNTTETDAVRYCVECTKALPQRSDLPMPVVQEATGEAKAVQNGGAENSSCAIGGLVMKYSSVVDIFCNGHCYESFYVKKRRGTARRVLWSLERGICRQCSLDTERLRSKLATLEPLAREAYFTEEVGGADAKERSFFSRLSIARRHHVLAEPHKGCRFWEADHVRAVVDGGGEANIDNFQTLCVACHAEKTRELAARRGTEQRAKRELTEQARQEACADDEPLQAVQQHSSGPRQKAPRKRRDRGMVRVLLPVSSQCKGAQKRRHSSASGCRI